MKRKPAALKDPAVLEVTAAAKGAAPLWQLDIVELAGHNIESRGREEVNRLLAEGWILLHIYTLKYEENGVWRERPMAILGRPRSLVNQSERASRNASSPGGLDRQSATARD
jgi:hypothetical protein